MANNQLRIYEAMDVTFNQETKLGKGSFGAVYAGIIANERVAVKILFDQEERFKHAQEKERAAAFKEIRTLANLDHPNVVKLLGIVQTNNAPWMVFEYMQDGCLSKHFLSHSATEGQIIGYCHNICEGMHYLHSQGICHRDLAARNVLLDKAKNVAKVADLGLSIMAQINPFKPYAVRSVGIEPNNFPVHHAAIECFQENKFSSASDVWSFGVTMCEIFNGSLHPFYEWSLEDVRIFICGKNTPLTVVKLNVSSEVEDILKLIFRVNRDQRPSFDVLRKRFNDLRQRDFPTTILAGTKRGLSVVRRVAISNTNYAEPQAIIAAQQQIERQNEFWTGLAVAGVWYFWIIPSFPNGRKQATKYLNFLETPTALYY